MSVMRLRSELSNSLSRKILIGTKDGLDGEKVVLHRKHDLWDILETEWVKKASTDRGKATEQQRWKYLAMLHLRVHCNWTYQMIGNVFGHNKGYVYLVIIRTVGMLKKIKELAEFYEFLDEKIEETDET